MKKRLEKEIKNIEDNSIILTIFPNDSYHELNMHLVKIITKKKPIGTYVTINRPYEKIVNLMEQKKIDHKKIFFLDCVSKKAKKAENCVFIGGIESLIPLSVALGPVYQNKEHAFVFFDSIDALSVYHNPNILIKFVRRFVQQMRENDKAGFMIGLREGTDKRIVDDIAAICDKIIDLSK